MCLEEEVDSRQYRFGFSINGAVDVPADFALPADNRLQAKLELVGLKNVHASGNIQRYRRPDTATLKIHLLQDSGAVLLSGEICVRRPFDLKGQAAVVGRRQRKPHPGVRLDAQPGTKRIALILGDGK